jgi:uncharacterized protein (TIGR02145 family)
MKNRFRIKLLPLMIMGYIVMFASSCTKNENGNGNGNENFSMKDGDGNVYSSVVIGTQEWLKENLKATKYNDGTTIPLVTDYTAWNRLETPGYCWLNNDEGTYKNVYGALYNSYAVNIGKLCPSGWHVPTDAEWTTLTTYLGGESIAGGKLKETGTAHWLSPNIGATNESGFSGLPGGMRINTGQFWSLGENGFWWSSTSEQYNGNYYRSLSYGSSDIHKSISSGSALGNSVRCIK